MLIRKMILNNFRNFKNTEINFSCDPKKKITIILGQNTYGKTTLVKAFIWCLYKINLFEDKILLNSDISDYLLVGKEETAKVMVEFEHKGVSYRITTKETYSRSSSDNIVVAKKAYSTGLKVVEQNTIPISENHIDEEIESILKPELKEYFFFDGETNSIEQVSAKKNLTVAVTNILGISTIEAFKEYYDPHRSDSVPSALRKDLISSDELNAIDLNNQLEKYTQQRQTYLDEIETIEREINELDNQLEEKNNLLDANKDVEKDQNDKKRLEKEIETAKFDKDKAFDRMIQIVNGSSAFLKILFAKSFVKYNLKELMEKSSFKSNSSYKGINEEAVNELIKAGRCICGAEIKNGNDAYRHLMEAKQHMEPHDYSKYISDFVSAEASNIYNAETICENIRSEAGIVNNKIEAIDEYETRLKTIRERIEGRLDVGSIQSEINNIMYQKGHQQSVLENSKSKIPDIEKKIDDINEKITKSSEANEENAFILKCIEYSNSIYQLAITQLEQSKMEIREKLQDEVSTIFKAMYHGNREIIIDENFRASAIVTDGNQDKNLDKSTGLGTVVNYSFVAGLMNLAKQSLLKNELTNDDNIGESYPLVMDAPFSNTDDEHIKNICKTLPIFCDQIIMFVMRKDYNYAIESIREQVGKLYRIQKESETDAIVCEEDL